MIKDRLADLGCEEQNGDFKDVFELNLCDQNQFLYSDGWINSEIQTSLKDLYLVKKLQNGSWGKPFNLGAKINTEYDEDFPFLHPMCGRTVLRYFAAVCCPDCRPTMRSPIDLGAFLGY